MLNRIVARIGAVYVYVTTMLSMIRAAQANHAHALYTATRSARAPPY